MRWYSDDCFLTGWKTDLGCAKKTAYDEGTGFLRVEALLVDL
jgi:hypothetical protein